MPLSVSDYSAEIEVLREQWGTLEALDKGTPAMREASTALLPKWPAEEDQAYRARLSVATLFPAYQKTCNVMGGKPFSKPIKLIDADKSIETWALDIDNQGVNLHALSAEMFRETVAYGLAGILVEYPKAPPGGFRSRAEQEASGQRPYWVRVKHDQILGWIANSIGGKMVLQQVRLLESYEELDGLYSAKAYAQVRVLFPGGWQIWRQTSEKSWVLFEEGLTSLSYIPFVPLYGVRKGFMIGHPPLIDLAYLNVKHWQSQSDQDTILHVARVPILAAKGTGDAFSLTVGASSAVQLGDNPDADLFYVEHTGAAISAGKDALLDLEEQMIRAGAELMVKADGNRSATEAANDAEGNKCELQRMAETFSDALELALSYTADFAGIPQARAGSVELYDQYGEPSMSDAMAQLVIQMQQSGLISKETAIVEMQRRGVLNAGVSAQDEADKVAEEGPALGTIDGNSQ